MSGIQCEVCGRFVGKDGSCTGGYEAISANDSSADTWIDFRAFCKDHIPKKVQLAEAPPVS